MVSCKQVKRWTGIVLRNYLFFKWNRKMSLVRLLQSLSEKVCVYKTKTCRLCPFILLDILFSWCRWCSDIIRFPGLIFRRVMINSDLIMERGDSRLRWISGAFYWCLYATLESLHTSRFCSRYFGLSFTTYALEKSLLKLCPSIRRLFITFHHFSPLFDCTLRGDHSFSHTSMDIIHIMLTFPLVDVVAVFSALCIWCLWHLSNLS